MDEVHMVGEKGGRGSNLEALITKVTFSGVEQRIGIVMSR